MKKAPIFLAFTANLFAATLFGQTDTVFTTLTQESGTLAPQQYLSDNDRAFGVLNPARWMFKLDLGHTLSRLFDSPSVHVGVENKLGREMSFGVDLQFAPSGSQSTEGQGQAFANYTFRAGASARWYYDMKKRMAAGRSASNFSGNYVAIEAATFRSEEFASTRSGTELVAKFGIQRRLLRYGYFDLSYGLGAKSYSTTVNSRGGWSLTSQPRVAVGLALFTPRKNNVPTGTACDILKCFQENRRLLKIDLYNLVRFGELSKLLSHFSLNPSVAYEQKIGNSPFSGELSLSGNGSLFHISSSLSQTVQLTDGRSGSAGAMAELRWYFLQKRRILQGKSGNNLSGLFFALNAAHDRGKSRYWFEEEKKSSSYNYTAVRGTIGLQHRITNHGFIQFKFGVGPKWTKGTNDFDTQNVAYQDFYPFDLYSEFKAGLAF